MRSDAWSSGKAVCAREGRRHRAQCAANRRPLIDLLRSHTRNPPSHLVTVWKSKAVCFCRAASLAYGTSRAWKRKANIRALPTSHSPSVMPVSWRRIASSPRGRHTVLDRASLPSALTLPTWLRRLAAAATARTLPLRRRTGSLAATFPVVVPGGPYFAMLPLGVYSSRPPCPWPLLLAAPEAATTLPAESPQRGDPRTDRDGRKRPSVFRSLFAPSFPLDSPMIISIRLPRVLTAAAPPPVSRLPPSAARLRGDTAELKPTEWRRSPRVNSSGIARRIRANGTPRWRATFTKAPAR